MFLECPAYNVPSETVCQEVMCCAHQGGWTFCWRGTHSRPGPLMPMCCHCCSLGIAVPWVLVTQQGQAAPGLAGEGFPLLLLSPAGVRCPQPSVCRARPFQGMCSAQPFVPRVIRLDSLQSTVWPSPALTGGSCTLKPKKGEPCVTCPWPGPLWQKGEPRAGPDPPSPQAGQPRAQRMDAEIPIPQPCAAGVQPGLDTACMGPSDRAWPLRQMPGRTYCCPHPACPEPQGLG